MSDTAIERSLAHPAPRTKDSRHAWTEYARALRWQILPFIVPVLLFSLWLAGSSFGWIAPQVLPAALPSVFTGIYLALIYSWLATLGAEYLLVAGSGIGNMLIDGSEQFHMDLVLFGIVVIGIVGWALNTSARLLERRIFAHRGR
jgi:ABC-type nitrate/sulfonate/bicarbonate transport system permease component